MLRTEWSYNGTPNKQTYFVIETISIPWTNINP